MQLDPNEHILRHERIQPAVFVLPSILLPATIPILPSNPQPGPTLEQTKSLAEAGDPLAQDKLGEVYRFSDINGKTLAPGEPATIKVDSRTINIHCLSITPNSATISIDGIEAPKELRLR